MILFEFLLSSNIIVHISASHSPHHKPRFNAHSASTLTRGNNKSVKDALSAEQQAAVLLQALFLAWKSRKQYTHLVQKRQEFLLLAGKR